MDAGVDAAAPDVVDAAPVDAAPAGPIGKNASAVARFGTEVALNEPKVILQTTPVHTSPSTGQIVTTLHAGTAVTRIATNANHSLIVFPDPNVPTDSLMGWVPDFAFSAATAVHTVDAGVPTTTGFACPPGKIGIQILGRPVCKPPCAADRDCKGARGCTTATAVGGGSTKACVND